MAVITPLLLDNGAHFIGNYRKLGISKSDTFVSKLALYDICCATLTTMNYFSDLITFLSRLSEKDVYGERC